MPSMTIDRLSSISIGHRDDNLIQKIEIDISSWQSKYPNLDTYRIEMVDAENRKQIALNTSVKDGYLIWIITNKNTAVEGEGSYQIIATGRNGEQKASREAALYVRSRIHGDGQEESPEYMKPLLDQVAENASRAEEAAKRAESAAVGKVPFATSDTAGIVKVGEGLIIEEDGTLSVVGGSGPSDPGAPGAPGEDGEDGGYYIPSVNEDGELTWTASKENMPKIPSTNIKGEPGEPGVPGEDGKDGKDGEDGEPGKSGVFVGSEEPTDPNISVWIDPNGETNLPTASATVRGGVKVGNGLQMDGDVLSVKPEGVYELIETITLEEDMAFDRTQEPDGTPYKFSAITLLIKKPKDITIATSISISAYVSPTITQQLYMPPCSKAEELWGLATVERCRGRFRRTRVADWYIFNTTSYIVEVPFQQFRYEFPENAAIYKLHTSAILPAGLTFEIWGVRA